MSLGLSLRTGGGDLVARGGSAGEVFSEYIRLGAFNLVKGTQSHNPYTSLLVNQL